MHPNRPTTEQLRIVSWNCAMGLRRKLDPLLSLEPDIAVIPEASEKDLRAIDAPFTAWFGTNVTKGLGVVGFRAGAYRLLAPQDDALPWYVPFEYEGLTILGVWTHVATRQLRYVRVLHSVVEKWGARLARGAAVTIGDFNSNTIWDREHGELCHSRLAERLNDLGMTSAYHRQTGEEQGGETLKTYAHTRNLRWQHHIDHAFLTDSLRSTLWIGPLEEWLTWSDHAPLVLDIEWPPPAVVRPLSHSIEQQ